MTQTAVAASRGVRLFTDMLLVRRFEERCAQAYAEQKIRGFMHLYIGEEAVAAGVLASVDPGDPVISTYREHAHALLHGVSAESIMAEMYGKQEGCCRGRGGSMHIFDAAAKFYGGNAIVGGGIPLALGFALADAMGKKPRALTCCFFGDGAVAEGEFHESMNLAALWRLPVLYVCENNLYAMGTRIDREHSRTDLYRKATAYDIASASVDGMDVEAVDAAAATACAYVRDGNGPYLLECRTYRYHGHSTADPQFYRTKAEVEAWKKRDPLAAQLAKLRARNEIDDTAIARLEADVAATIARAVEAAEAGTLESVDQLTRYVYRETES